MKAVVKSLSLSSQTCLTQRTGFSPLSKVSILAMVEGRSEVKSLSPRCQVISVGSLGFSGASSPEHLSSLRFQPQVEEEYFEL